MINKQPIRSAYSKSYFAAAVAAGFFFSGQSADAVETSKSSFISDAIHSFGPQGNSDFYGGGNDGSGFEEFGITAFQFDSTTDFGGPLAAINSIEFDLTYNDRNFTTDGTVEFFLTTLASADYVNLSYDAASTAGINSAQFGSNTPLSLGQRQFSAINDGLVGGETVTYSLTLSGLAESTLRDAINSNSEFSILIGGIDASVEATFSGVGNTFDPGDPLLRVNADVVPEPSAILLLLAAGACFIYLRRRSNSAA